MIDISFQTGSITAVKSLINLPLEEARECLLLNVQGHTKLHLFERTFDDDKEVFFRAFEILRFIDELTTEGKATMYFAFDPIADAAIEGSTTIFKFRDSQDCYSADIEDVLQLSREADLFFSETIKDQEELLNYFLQRNFSIH